VQTKPATHTQRWMPPRRFAGFGAKAPPSASQRTTANRYGITLDRARTEWAAQQGLSETVAAALYLRLNMWLTVNGESRQKGSTRPMVFGVPHLVWHCSPAPGLVLGEEVRRPARLVVVEGVPAGCNLANVASASVLLCTYIVARMNAHAELLAITDNCWLRPL
jgi:hypothetical protein